MHVAAVSRRNVPLQFEQLWATLPSLIGHTSPTHRTGFARLQPVQTQRLFAAHVTGDQEGGSAYSVHGCGEPATAAKRGTDANRAFVLSVVGAGSECREFESAERSSEDTMSVTRMYCITLALVSQCFVRASNVRKVSSYGGQAEVVTRWRLSLAVDDECAVRLRDAA